MRIPHTCPKSTPGAQFGQPVARWMRFDAKSYPPVRIELVHTLAEFTVAGFALVPDLFFDYDLDGLRSCFKSAGLQRSRAGIRHVLHHPAVVTFAVNPQLVQIASSALGRKAHPFRATLFDKSRTANWLVAWHQDTALPLRDKRDLPGWGPWSQKDGIHYAHAPAYALERMVALRVHLDDSSADNGPLRVIPGTHRRGVLSDEEVSEIAASSQPVDCVIGRGGVIAMRPLIIHASSKSVGAMPRRVLHIE